MGECKNMFNAFQKDLDPRSFEIQSISMDLLNRELTYE